MPEIKKYMSEDELKDTIRSIPDFPKEGILFRDITTLLKNGPAYRSLIDTIADELRPFGIDIVIGPEARGFVIGSAVAYALGAGFVLARKPGKLPCETAKVSYGLEVCASPSLTTFLRPAERPPQSSGSLRRWEQASSQHPSR